MKEDSKRRKRGHLGWLGSLKVIGNITFKN